MSAPEEFTAAMRDAIAEAEAAFAKALAEVFNELREIRALVEGQAARPVFDVHALRGMGIPQHRAYEICRVHGVKFGGTGKYLISAEALRRALAEEHAEQELAA